MKEHEILHEMNQLKAEMAELKKSNESKGIKGYLGRAMNRTSVIAGVLIAGLLATAVLYATRIPFLNGEIIDADHVNDNFTELYTKVTALETQNATNSVIMVPVGSIVAWTNKGDTLSLPNGWRRCDGQPYSDFDLDNPSPFHNTNLPDLNGASDGSNGRFLRGGSTSGVMQEYSLENHRHWIVYNGGINSNLSSELDSWYPIYNYGASGGDTQYSFDSNNTEAVPGGIDANVGVVSEPIANTSTGTVSVDDETRPVNMSVIWIIRVK